MCDLQVALTYFCNSGLVMMPKAWPLCTSAESNLGDRIVGEVDKEKFYCLARQSGKCCSMNTREEESVLRRSKCSTKSNAAKR